MVVRIVEGYSAVLTQQVQAGELDFAVVPAFSGAPGLKSRLFLRTPEVLVSSARSDLPHLAPVRLASLGPLKLVGAGKANTRRRLIETYSPRTASPSSACSSSTPCSARSTSSPAPIGSPSCPAS